ncbi:MAG: hypothetical protein NVS1B10_08190 [Candidatus Saccharimonadales bacterium]
MNNFILWDDESFSVSTPKNPHIPYNEGAHLIIAPKRAVPNAWADVTLSAAAFRLASATCQIMEKIQFATWFNIQANGNWGLLPGGQPFFHVHIYSRNKTKTWGKPVILPEAPGTYQHEPMPEADRIVLRDAFASSLT